MEYYIQFGFTYPIGYNKCLQFSILPQELFEFCLPILYNNDASIAN